MTYIINPVAVALLYSHLARRVTSPYSTASNYYRSWVFNHLAEINAYGGRCWHEVKLVGSAMGLRRPL